MFHAAFGRLGLLATQKHFTRYLYHVYHISYVNVVFITEIMETCYLEYSHDTIPQYFIALSLSMLAFRFSLPLDNIIFFVTGDKKVGIGWCTTLQ